MPYRRTGRTIYVKRVNRWQILKTHDSVAKAIKHLAALNINVGKHRKIARRKRARKKRR